MSIFKKGEVKMEAEESKEINPEYPKKGQSHSGTVSAYSVEARYNYPEPKQFGDIILHKEWKKMYFPEGKHGVPVGNKFDYAQIALGLLSYQAAQALRWWLHAEAEVEMLGGLCLETRIVKHMVTFSVSEEKVSHHDIIGGEDRSNCVPDWGKKDE